ncbi:MULTISPECIES: DsbA family protein [Kocuria]|uniref:Thioredoxin domain-containing protein n=1 Tax=Kocuria subflava TaxID=1736139 RepID=A0A846TNJ6_9MICC|nr:MULTISPECIES: thioredoxin domain-containing protein [Kocuria]NKE08520.1 thioredoxin domain-containing protein [Kocuria subflava]
MPSIPALRIPGRHARSAAALLGASVLLLTACGGNGTDGSGDAAATQSAAEQTAGTTEQPAASDPQAGGDGASQGQDYVDEAINSGYALNTVDDLPVVTMYTDYECPACQSAHPLVEQAAESLDGTVTVMVKNYPLPIHDNAVPTARAVEAAAMQDQAHEYASHLYENAEDWTPLSGGELDDYFVTTAEDLGLDVDQFTGDYSSGAVAQIVDAHSQQAGELELPGTPSFVVADQQVDLENVRTADDLAGAFEDATDSAGSDAATPAGGTAEPTPGN